MKGYDGQNLTLLPLTKRKHYLKKALRKETGCLAVSRFLSGQGTDLFYPAQQQNPEGIVAKRKDSIYIEGKRTTDWIKIKNLKDDDFVVCAQIPPQRLSDSSQAGALITGSACTIRRTAL